MAIISAVGTREYYKKFGYKLRGTYMVKELNNPHIWVDIIATTLMILASCVVIYTLY